MTGTPNILSHQHTLESITSILLIDKYSDFLYHVSNQILIFHSIENRYHCAQSYAMG